MQLDSNEIESSCEPRISPYCVARLVCTDRFLKFDALAKG